MMSQEQIASRADDLLARMQALTCPVDVESVAAILGVQVHRQPLEDDVSGMLLVKGDSKHIIVNAGHHSNRQRFTIAHELGHLQMHHESGDQLFVDTKLMVYQRTSGASARTYGMPGSTTNAEQEREANVFAASLLMPKTLLSEFIEHRGLDLADEFDVALLATAFEVSEQAMSIRLKNLDLVTYTF